MLRSFAVFFAILSLAFPLSALAHHGPAEVSLEAKMGDIKFPHGDHQDNLKIECQKCHHTGTDPVQKCSKCHNGDSSAPSKRDAFHNLCKGCHQENGGPTACKGCHKK